MIVSICANQISEYSFSVTNNVSDQTYNDAGIDILNDVTEATLSFQRVNEVGDLVTVDIFASWAYLFETGGITINFEDFGEDLINGYDYWPDELYTITITYTYLGTEYTATTTVGFLKLIKNIVYQKTMRSNWKKELSCNCDCGNNNTVLRQWDFLKQLEIAAALCLISTWQTILAALYKITGTTYELS